MGVNAPPPLAQLLPMGVIGRPHGVHGELSLRPYTAGSRGRFFEPGRTVWAETANGLERLAIAKARPGGDAWLVKLVGIESREAASRFTNNRVLVERAALPSLEEGEFYVADTVGLEVRDQAGSVLGRVSSTFWNGAQDIAVVHAADGHETLIPLVSVVVQRVDIAQGTIVVDWQIDDGEGSGEGPDGEVAPQEAKTGPSDAG